MKKRWNVLDLFSGIGGFSLGLERAGMKTVAFCEIEKYPQSKLKKHWPNVPIIEDIKKLTKELLYKTLGQEVKIDVITAGVPCQPASQAGKREGEKDDRWLWPEALRVVQEFTPEWVIFENVYGFVTLNNGLEFENVLSDLESQGYKIQSFIIPACAVGGIHRRDRIWIIAHASSCGSEQSSCASEVKRQTFEFRKEDFNDVISYSSSKRLSIGRQKEQQEISQKGQTRLVNELKRYGGSGFAANSNSHRLQRGARREGVETQVKPQQERGEIAGADSQAAFKPCPIPTESPIRLRNDGLSENVARLKALGNSVMPQIPELIGRAIIAQHT